MRHRTLRWLTVAAPLLFPALSSDLSLETVLRQIVDLARDALDWGAPSEADSALATGATLGLLLALSKQVSFLAGLTLPILGSHAILMLGGWVTPLLTGVAYRLVSMFTLSEDRLRTDQATPELVADGRGRLDRGSVKGRMSRETGSIAPRPNDSGDVGWCYHEGLGTLEYETKGRTKR